MAKLLNKFCSVAKKGTIIMPKKIPGYITPEGQVLRTDGQKIEFKYKPIKYKIEYDLGEDGKFSDKDKETLKTFYTIEDNDYVVTAIPTRKNYIFNGWEPKSIKRGTVGDIKLSAKWIAESTLAPGYKINSLLKQLAGGAEYITGFRLSDKRPDPTTSVDISDIYDNSEPILASFDKSCGVISLYCKHDIVCGENMNYAFANMPLLSNIECFRKFICRKGETDIVGIFEGCTLLSNVDPIANWGEQDWVYSECEGAFNGTAALNSGRVPSWYKYKVSIVCLSSTGKEIRKDTRLCYQGETIGYKFIDGYECVNKEAVIEKFNIIGSKDDIVFTYRPKEFQIKYSLNSGELINPKTIYTVEDEDYYPPEPFKPGYKFIGWTGRNYIPSGHIGDVTFIADYKSIDTTNKGDI